MIGRSDERVSEWTCGHVAGAVCAECYRNLAIHAHVLAMECERMREQLRWTDGDTDDRPPSAPPPGGNKQ